MDITKQARLVSNNDWQELSPYARFMIDNKGFEFYRRRDNMKIDKWEIFSIFEKHPNELVKVCIGKNRFYGRRVK